VTIDLQKEVERLRAENAQLKEAIREFALPPYHDSNLASWAEWVNARALVVLSQTPPTPAKETCQCGKGSSGYCGLHKHGWMNTPKPPGDKRRFFDSAELGDPMNPHSQFYDDEDGLGHGPWKKGNT
jgi:hypothetical protein